MTDYRDDLAAAHARIDALEAERDTDPAPAIVPDDIAHPSLGDRMRDWNEAHPSVGWSAVVLGVAMLIGSSIAWCNG